MKNRFHWNYHIIFQFYHKISLNVTNNGPPIVHPSVCWQKLLFLVNVTSVTNFNNKRLKISFEQIVFNFFLLYI